MFSSTVSGRFGVVVNACRSVSTSVPRPAAVAGALVAFASLAAAGCRQTAIPATVRPEARVPRIAPPRDGRGGVVGVVADSATGFPVVGAAVFFTRDSVIGVGRATPRPDLPADTTARDGSFALRDLPPGRYTLATDGLDHHPARRIVIVRAGEVDTVVLRPRRRGLP
jgi:hypothetical protein